ncbi:hypothetical protein BGX27_006454 [Mortierella sp. AM989]|nr:hypothetical protein BGX27_006454 [Mortierella sp. AM989]
MERPVSVIGVWDNTTDAETKRQEYNKLICDLGAANQKPKVDPKEFRDKLRDFLADYIMPKPEKRKKDIDDGIHKRKCVYAGSIVLDRYASHIPAYSVPNTARTS